MNRITIISVAREVKILVTEKNLYLKKCLNGCVNILKPHAIFLIEGLVLAQTGIQNPYLHRFDYGVISIFFVYKVKYRITFPRMRNKVTSF